MRARPGLEPGDLILSFDGAAVNGIDDLHRALRAEHIGKPAAVTVLRRAQLLTLRIRPDEMM